MNGGRVARGYDRLSRVWDLGVRSIPRNGIPRSRVGHIERARGRSRALVMGGGTGAFVEALLDSGFAGDVVYQDISPVMTRLARRRIAGTHPRAFDRVEFHCADAMQDLPDGPFDLICTHYFLDQFAGERLRRIVDRLDSRLCDRGVWLCSDFAEAAGGPVRRATQALLLGGLYAGFGLACGIAPRRLPPIERELKLRGYSEVARTSHGFGLVWSGAYRPEPGRRR